MTFFFFTVGLEIKREVLVGALASRKMALLPVIGAIGGMLVPGIIYFAFNHGTETAAGWGIPMATDIAFALGAIAIFGRRLPIGLRVFLTAFAIADDAFTCDRDYVIRLCNKIVGEGFDIEWDCGSNAIRLDTLDEELLRVMEGAGCTCVGVGIESGSPRVLALMNKRLDLKMVREKLLMIKKREELLYQP